MDKRDKFEEFIIIYILYLFRQIILFFDRGFKHKKYFVRRLIDQLNSSDIFLRFLDEDLFESIDVDKYDDTPIYILTDRPISRKLYPVIKNLDSLTDKQISESIFIIYYLFDTDALVQISKITDLFGRYIPHINYTKTSYRFIDPMASHALVKTWSKKDRVSHLYIGIHENICEALMMTCDLNGDYVEIGVYKGGSALTALNYLDELNRNQGNISKRVAYLYDTFDGFDYKEAEDSSDVIWFGTHKFKEVESAIDYIQQTFSDVSTQYSLIVKNICVDNIDEVSRISVANIDVDMYEPTLAALYKVSDRIVPGGIIICEDPASTPALYGALLAMEEFLASEKGLEYIKIFKKDQYFLIKNRL